MSAPTSGSPTSSETLLKILKRFDSSRHLSYFYFDVICGITWLLSVLLSRIYTPWGWGLSFSDSPLYFQCLSPGPCLFDEWLNKLAWRGFGRWSILHLEICLWLYRLEEHLVDTAGRTCGLAVVLGRRGRWHQHLLLCSWLE